ncbi:hypothetical protein MCHI_003386 [Candidatus Magnetoovum chiemensis]|nr:hypothetical protein MCHI_003386 [Candidatus Magnetoovum chiemensis]
MLSMSETIFLFGAGASAPLGLPDSKGFFKNYTPPSTLTPLFNFICNVLANNKKEELDLETVFSLLSFYRDISSNFGLKFLKYALHTGEIEKIAAKDLVNSFVPHYYTGSAFVNKPTDVNAAVSAQKPTDMSAPIAEQKESKCNYTSIAAMIDELSEKAKQLDKDIKHHVYTVFSNFDKEELLPIYEPIFGPVLKDQNGKLTIFTTNYDLIFENLFNTPKGIRSQWKEYGVENIYLGFIFRMLFFIFEPSFVQPSNGTVELYKLHGSLNWDEAGGHVFMAGTTRLPKDPEVPAFIYPGYNGVPEKEPFKSLHYLFAQRLQKSATFITIGFSFRDLYINTIISQSLAANDKLNLYALAPEFPQNSGFALLKTSFNDRVHHIKGKLEENDLWKLIEDAE